jgi:hypothetical protein
MSEKLSTSRFFIFIIDENINIEIQMKSINLDYYYLTIIRLLKFMNPILKNFNINK